MSPTPDSIRAALALIADPHTATDLIASQAVRGVGVDGSRGAIDIQLGYPAAGWRDALVAQIEQAVRAIPGVDAVTVTVSTRLAAHRAQKDFTTLPEGDNNSA